jgi:hypothetical protein
MIRRTNAAFNAVHWMIRSTIHSKPNQRVVDFGEQCHFLVKTSRAPNPLQNSTPCRRPSQCPPNDISVRTGTPSALIFLAPPRSGRLITKQAHLEDWGALLPDLACRAALGFNLASGSAQLWPQNLKGIAPRLVHRSRAGRTKGQRWSLHLPAPASFSHS